MVKIRLQRMGRKNQPFYRIVAADSKNARNGKILEIIGHYNPMVKPSDIKFDKALLEKWVKVGAQMTETVKRITKSK